MSLRKDKIFEAATALHQDEVDIAKPGQIKTAPEATPDPTPPDKRYVRPGYVQLEWLGDTGPLAQWKLRIAADMGLFPRDVLAALEQTTERLTWTTRIPLVTRRDMTVERDGMSQDYSWGPKPGTYVQDVAIADADRILSGSSGQEFRLLSYDGQQPCNFDPVDRFIVNPLTAAGRSIEAQEIAAKVRSMVVTERDAERLAGVEVVQGRDKQMVRTGRGEWTPTK